MRVVQIFYSFLIGTGELPNLRNFRINTPKSLKGGCVSPGYSTVLTHYLVFLKCLTLTTNSYTWLFQPKNCQSFSLRI